MESTFRKLGLTICFLGFYGFAQFAFAQDVIVVHGNKEIWAKVVSISSDGVEYRLYDEEDSPLYKLQLQEVVSLRYENGRVEDLSLFLPKANEKQAEKTAPPQELEYFEDGNVFYLDGRRLSDAAIERTLLSNSKALYAWKKGNSFKVANKAMKIATGVLVGTGGALSLYSLRVATFGLSEFARKADNWVWICYFTGNMLFLSGVVTGIMIPAMKVRYQSWYSGAAEIYNKGVKSKNTVSLHIGATENGLGVSLRF